MQFGFGKAVTSRSDNPTLPTSVVAQYPTDSFHLSIRSARACASSSSAVRADLAKRHRGRSLLCHAGCPSGLRADNLATVSVFGKLGLLGVF